jgi:hypothetical protein
MAFGFNVSSDARATTSLTGSINRPSSGAIDEFAEITDGIEGLEVDCDMEVKWSSEELDVNVLDWSELTLTG